MQRVLNQRPSGATVVAVVALVIATTGTAIAAGLANGDKLIRKDSLSGNRLRNHTLTGKQINLSRLGTVPSANKANTANRAATAITAGHASNADTATNASTAANAVKVDGEQMVSLSTAVTAGPMTKQFMNLGGVTITVGCSAGPHAPSMTISNTSNPHQVARVNIEAVEAGSTIYQTHGDFSGTTLLTPGVSAGTGQANVVFTDKHVVTIDYSFENNSGAFGDCAFYGHAISG